MYDRLRIYSVIHFDYVCAIRCKCMYVCVRGLAGAFPPSAPRHKLVIDESRLRARRARQRFARAASIYSYAPVSVRVYIIIINVYGQLSRHCAALQCLRACVLRQHRNIALQRWRTI